MKKLVGVCLLLAAFIAVNAEDIPQDPVNIADEVEEDRDDIDDEDEEYRDDIDDEDEEDRDDIDEEDEDEEDEEDRNELIDMIVEDRRNPPVEKSGIRCDAKALGPIIHTGSLRINTPRQCQKHCEKWNIDHPDRPQCQFFRWRGRDFKAKWGKRRRCYLLKKVTDVKKRRGWCWGPRECKEEDVAPTNEVAPTKKVSDIQIPYGYTARRGDCPGNDIKDLTSNWPFDASLEECYRLCSSTPRCQAFMWRDQRICYPKTISCSNPSPTDPYFTSVFYSKNGIKTPYGYSVMMGDCPGNDIKNLAARWPIMTDNLDECSFICTSSSQCKAFMWRDQTTCYPKTLSCNNPTLDSPFFTVFYTRK